MNIYFLEGRGGMYIYHFIVYNLGGLYYIENNIDVRGPPATSVLFKRNSQNIELVNNLNFEGYPINLVMDDLNEWQKDVLSCLKHKINLIYDIPVNSKIKSVYGETCMINPYSDNNSKVYPFLRNLFLENKNYSFQNKNIFITRRGSDKFHSGIQKRLILNEDSLMDMLKKYNFEYINLENLNFEEKIKLFNTSKIIISSHSGGLVCSLFANEHTNIVEIVNRGTSGVSHDHYKFICSTLNIPYYRYSNIEEDINGNFNLDINNFEKFLLNLI